MTSHPPSSFEVVREKAWERRADGAVHRAHWKVRVDPLTFWGDASPGSDAEGLASRFVERLRPRLYDDVVPTLRQLSPRALLGVLTNSPHVDVELEALQIADRFAAVAGVVDPIRTRSSKSSAVLSGSTPMPCENECPPFGPSSPSSIPPTTRSARSRRADSSDGQLREGAIQ